MIIYYKYDSEKTKFYSKLGIITVFRRRRAKNIKAFSSSN